MIAEIGASFRDEILALTLSTKERTLESEARSTASMENWAEFMVDAIFRSLLVFSSLDESSRTVKIAK